jgi:hypothetical protein
MMWKHLTFAAAILSVVAAPPRPAFAGDAPAATKKTPEEEADNLIRQAEDAYEKKLYPTARSAIEIVLKAYPKTPAANRARELQKIVPNERGRLILGFDEDKDIHGSGAEWVTDEKLVPVGKGAAHIVNLRGRHVKFKIDLASFNDAKYFSFWVWSSAPNGGLSNGTTYFCLYTDDKKDYLSASFQMRGDEQWRVIQIDAGRFKEWKEAKARKFTAIGFWNPSRAEVRDFLVDDIRVVEEEAPKAGPALVAPTDGKSLPPLVPPK